MVVYGYCNEDDEYFLVYIVYFKLYTILLTMLNDPINSTGSVIIVMAINSAN